MALVLFYFSSEFTVSFLLFLPFIVTEVLNSMVKCFTLLLSLL